MRWELHHRAFNSRWSFRPLCWRDLLLELLHLTAVVLYRLLHLESANWVAYGCSFMLVCWELILSVPRIILLVVWQALQRFSPIVGEVVELAMILLMPTSLHDINKAPPLRVMLRQCLAYGCQDLFLVLNWKRRHSKSATTALFKEGFICTFLIILLPLLEIFGHNSRLFISFHDVH